ncbi:hypothetical protein LPJ64_001125 [Coemansia asiatica]|uniref:Mediator of RNA polymerase II transcription subunit 1 n=1 Tax=Coemansia asiatica TaxID=1052880 RepID=A0A9W8CKB0_9FUNG|nr:hypothetical protein LPJ64_001125 [Coemansia asiatica]KAJ2881651.1 hypothetical protein FB639_002567 [Coemansia asiatica]
MSVGTPSLLPQPLRTISDEFRELQYIIDQFQTQLNAPDGTIGLHPFGQVNVEKAQVSFTQACSRLRDALAQYRDITLTSWNQVIRADIGQAQAQGMVVSANIPVLAATNRAAVSAQELLDMRKITDALYEDAGSCKKLLFDAAANSISHALLQSDNGLPTLLVERLAATAKRLGLAHYTDVQKRGDNDEVTTVTLAGGILVIDVDIGSKKDQLKVKVSYVSDIEHDERIDTLMLGRLLKGDIRGFENLVEQMAQLDRLTKEHSPANFIYNSFSLVSTLAEIQSQELDALDGDIKQLLRYGSGISLPHTRHVGPSTLFFVPATIKSGLSAQDWTALQDNNFAAVADIPGLRWLCYSWEPSSTSHCFLSALFQQHCLKPDYAIEDSDTHKVVTVNHPNIHGLELRFLEFIKQKRQEVAGLMQVDDQETHTDINSDFWAPYTMVAWLESSLPACALTVRKIMAAVSPDAKIEVLSPSTDKSAETLSLDSPRLLEDAPTLEQLVYKEYKTKQGKEFIKDRHVTTGSTTVKAISSPSSPSPSSSSLSGIATSGAKIRRSSTHTIKGHSVVVELETPQIRAWSICRIPLNHPRNVLGIVPLLRRQAVFNELLASCFNDSSTLDANSKDNSNTEAIAKLSVKTFANDPFRIDILLRDIQRHVQNKSEYMGKRPKTSDEKQENMDISDSDENAEGQEELLSPGQGVILRVIEATSDILAWTHQSLGITHTDDLLTAMSGVATSSLTKATSHSNLSMVANLSNSIPMIAYWLNSNTQ